MAHSLFSAHFRAHPRPTGKQIASELESYLPATIQDIVDNEITLDVGTFDVDNLQEKTITHGISVDVLTLIKDGDVGTVSLTASGAATAATVVATTSVTSPAIVGSTSVTSPSVVASTAFTGAAVTVTGPITTTTAQTDYLKFLGINDILGPSVGVWTLTRIAIGDYVLRKTVTAETAILGFDITEAVRTTSLKGFKLTGFDVIHRNTTTALSSHSATLSNIVYVSGSAVSTTSVAITGTLATTAQANPLIGAMTVTTPAFQTTADSVWVIELSVGADTTSVYDFIGIVLKFTQNSL
jgi:hypothetical protein